MYKRQHVDDILEVRVTISCEGVVLIDPLNRLIGALLGRHGNVVFIHLLTQVQQAQGERWSVYIITEGLVLCEWQLFEYIDGRAACAGSPHNNQILDQLLDILRG